MEAVKRQGCALEYASKELRGDGVRERPPGHGGDHRHGLPAGPHKLRGGRLFALGALRRPRPAAAA
eukprot:4295127-Heterocapsa_arctica.AAC.1